MVVRWAPVLLLGAFAACHEDYVAAVASKIVNAATSSVDVNPSTAVADGNSAVVLRATVRNMDGFPLAGLPLTFSVTGSDNVLTPAGTATDANGTVTATLTSTQPETKTVTAMVKAAAGPVNLLDAPTVVFTAQPPSALYSRMSVNPNVMSADGNVLVSVYVYDASDRPIAGEVVTFASSVAGIWLSNPNTTDSTGYVQTTYHGTRAGNQNLTASFGSVVTTASVYIVAGQANSSTSTLSISPNVIVSNGETSTLTLTLLDAYGNPIDGNTVTWSANPSSNNTITVSANGNTTNANGVAVATFTANANQITTVSATAGGITLQGNIVVHSPPTASSCTFTANPNTAVADGVSAITLTVHVNAGDPGGGPVANQNVTFTASGRGVTFNPSSGLTNSGGNFTATMTCIDAGVQAVQAVIDGNIALSQNVTFTMPTCNASVLLPGLPLVPTPAGAPLAVAPGDFNKDGSMDYAVLLDSNTVSVFLGSNNGKFGSAINTALPFAATTLITNPNDTSPDLLVADTQGFQWLAGNGNGTFQAPYAQTAIHNAVQLALSDLNHDGKPDVLQLDATNGAVGVALAAPAPSRIYLPTISYTTGGAGVQSTSFTVGDFNNDGHPDVIVTNASGGSNGGALAYLPGNGNAPWFGTPVEIDLSASGTAPVYVLDGNFNSDHFVDLAVLEGGTNQVAILLGQGNATFAAPDIYPGPSHGVVTVGALSDINNDTWLDFMALDGESIMTVMLGNPNGNFQPIPNVEVGLNPMGPPVFLSLNNDIYNDALVPANGAGGVTVLLGAGDGTFPTPLVATAPSGGSDGVATGNLFGNGFADVLAQSASTLQAYANDGNGKLSSSGKFSRSGAYGQVLIADFSGDGNNDYVAVLGGNIVITLGDGAGNFAAETQTMPPGAVTALQVGDINHDGKQDVVAVGTSLYVYTGTGTGALTGLTTYIISPAVGSTTAPPVLVDLNGDAYPEVLLVSNSSSNPNLAVFMNQGTAAPGTLSASPLTYAVTGGGGTGGQISLVAADFNGDHNQDVAAGFANGGVAVLLGAGDGTVQFKSYTSSSVPFTLGATDMNGDAKADIIVGGVGVEILAGKGDGTFKSAITYAAGQCGTHGQVVADMNGDGRPDVLSVDPTELAVLVLLSSGCF